MGFEKFFIKPQELKTSPQKEEEELSAEGKARRAVLVGSAALAASAIIGNSNSAEAGGVSGTAERIIDPQHNTLLLRALQKKYLALQGELGDSKSNYSEIIEGITPSVALLKEGVKEYVSLRANSLDSALDYTSVFKARGSWPSVQMRTHSEGSPRIVRYAHEANIETRGKFKYGNSFFIDGLLVGNRHSLKDSFECEYLTGGEDIASCAIADIDASQKGTQNLNHEDINKVMLQWDRRKSSDILHGRLGFITSIHERRGESTPDNTDVAPTVFYKIPESFFWSADKEGKSFFNKNTTEAFKNELQRSYMCFIDSPDTNGDKVGDDLDALGMSGSPVFTEEDCENKATKPSGIVWGTGAFTDNKGVLHTYALVHGPDVLGEIIDKSNTIVSMYSTEAELPEKQSLTRIVQSALRESGYTIEIDGEYGEATQAAVFDFQQKVFDEEVLRSSIIWGDVDRRTWDVLLNKYAGMSKRVLYSQL